MQPSVVPEENIFELSLHANEKKNKADIVYQKIKDGLIVKYWLPGDRLHDEKIAKQLGVSRTSVREALSKLVECKIVEKGHWKGFQVRRPTLTEIESSIDLRLSIEILSLKSIEKKLSQDALDNLIADLYRIIEIAMNYIDGDTKLYNTYDMGFHKLLYTASQNFWLPDIMENIHTVSDFIRIPVEKFIPEARKISSSEHIAITNAIQDRDFKKAEKLLINHIEAYRERTKQSYNLENGIKK